MADQNFSPHKSETAAVCEVLFTPEELVREASDHAPILAEVR